MWLLSAEDQGRRDQVGTRWQSVQQGSVIITIEERLPRGPNHWSKKLIEDERGPREEGLLRVRSIDDEGKHKGARTLGQAMDDRRRCPR